MVSTNRAEAKAVTWGRILDAAIEVFAREGYHAARMDAIARAAAQWLAGALADLDGAAPSLSALLLRSVGAAVGESPSTA